MHEDIVKHVNKCRGNIGESGQGVNDSDIELIIEQEKAEEDLNEDTVMDDNIFSITEKKDNPLLKVIEDLIDFNVIMMREKKIAEKK